MDAKPGPKALFCTWTAAAAAAAAAAAWRSLEPGVRTTPSNSPAAHLSDMSYCSMMHFLVRLTQVGSGFIS